MSSVTGQLGEIERFLKPVRTHAINPLHAQVGLVLIARTSEGNATQGKETLQGMFHEERIGKVNVVHLGASN